MLRNCLVIILRNFWRNKTFSLINVLGLAIGISASIIIYMVVHYEFTFEKFRPEKESIYRVVHESDFQGQVSRCSGVSFPTPRAIRGGLTGVEALTHFIINGPGKVKVPYREGALKLPKGAVFADEYFFDVFSHEWLAGSPLNRDMKKPHQVVLTKSRAELYFGNVDPQTIIGRELVYADTIRTTVCGIVKDLPTATDLAFTEIISLETVYATGLKNHYSVDNWSSINTDSQLFFKLEKGTDPVAVAKQVAAAAATHLKPAEKENANSVRLQALTDIHYNPMFDAVTGSSTYKPALYGLMAVGLFLLLLAAINFINLTTAQSVQRAKEIGVRKTMGSSRKQLAIQFFGETFTLTLISSLLSLLFVPFLLQAFSEFLRPEIAVSQLASFHFALFMAALVVLVSFLSGIYPAVVLSRFKPMNVMKNQLHKNSAVTRVGWFRKSLTVSQFVIAQFLLIVTIGVVRQVHYSTHRDLGFAKEGIIFFDVPSHPFKGTDVLKNELLLQKLKAIPEISKVSLGGYPPASQSGMWLTMPYEDKNGKHEHVIEMKFADTSYFDIYKLKVIAGRLMHQSDTSGEILINDTYRKRLGFSTPEAAIGTMINKSHVVGVLADFINRSTHSGISPIAYYNSSRQRNIYHVLLRNDINDRETWHRGIDMIGKAASEIYPNMEFSSTFFDESVAAFYKSERDISNLLGWASGMCILISCLGLWGLSIYTVNRRTREIGVRKVFGASVIQIMTLLYKDFLWLVAIAFVISSPLGWMAVEAWLRDFAFRINPGVSIIATTGLSMLLLSMLILGARIFRASTANPVTSLRTE
jgi:putative ABC transport system permease protein